MATNLNGYVEAPLETENTALLAREHICMESQGSSCRRRLLFLGRLLLCLGCLSYSLYLIWLLSYLKDNPYYWFISLVPFIFNVLMPLIGILKKTMSYNSTTMLCCCKTLLNVPSVGVAMTLMTCFTMLTRVAYYHRQPDEFIGPRFIIMSLQGSIILIALDCFVQREFKVQRLLDFKDALTRLLLDFVDIFNMIEILSLNDCVGIGSLVLEESSTEMAIQAFCTMSFLIVFSVLDVFMLNSRNYVQEPDSPEVLYKTEELLYSVVLAASYTQNLPFLWWSSIGTRPYSHDLLSTDLVYGFHEFHEFHAVKRNVTNVT